MLRDEKVFIIGEEVARYNGAYKVRVNCILRVRDTDEENTSGRSRRASWTSSARSVS